MNENIKVTVIVLSYNPRERIDQSVERLMCQTLKEIEIMYVDNDSTDGTVERLLEYQEKDSRIKVVPRKKNIFSGGLNSGITKARGEYLLFIGDDDWLDADCLEKTYQKAKEFDTDLLVFNGRDVYEDDSLRYEKTYGTLHLDKYKNLIEPITGLEYWKTEIQNQGMVGAICNFLVKKEFLDEENIKFHNDMHYFCDALFGLHILLAAEKVFFEDSTYFNYFIRRGSSMRNLEHDVFCQKLHKKQALSYFVELLQLYERYDITCEKYAVVYSYLDYCKEVVLENHYKANPQVDLFQLYFSLLTLERCHGEQSLLQAEQVAMTFLPKENISRHLSDKKFCFFGCGSKGKKALEYFKENQLPLPVCICDNNKNIHGTSLEGISVVSLDEATAKYGVENIVITTSDYYTNISKQINELSGSSDLKLYKLLNV